MSTFDPDTFLSTQIEGKLETEYTPLPEDDYEGYVDDVAAGTVGSDNSPVLKLTLAITDEKAKKFMERDKPLHTETVFLEFEEDGRLAMGKNKNTKLGQFREAAGQNGTQAWAPSMLRGAGPMIFKLKHRYNKETGEGPFAFIARVTSAAPQRTRRGAA